MKNRKILLIIALVAVIAIAAIALAGCNDKPEKVFAGNSPNLNGYTEAKQIYPGATGAIAIEGTELIFFTIGETNEYALYNFVTDQELQKFTAGSGEVEKIGDMVVLVKSNTVNEDESIEVMAFDCKGTALGSFVSAEKFTVENKYVNLSSGTASVNYVIVNNTVYILKDGELVTSFEKGASFDSDIAEFNGESNNYLYFKDGLYIKAFNKSNGQLHVVADLTENAFQNTDKTTSFFLSEDKIVVQYRDKCKEDANSYDFLVGNQKFEIRTFIYDVEKAKWKEKKSFKYFIIDISAAEHEGASAFDESVTDIMTACKFSGKELSGHMTVASVNDSLKIKIDFDDVFNGYKWHRAYADGYIIETTYGEAYFVSKDGKNSVLVSGDYENGDLDNGAGVIENGYLDNGAGVIYQFSDGKLNQVGIYDVAALELKSIVGGYAIYYSAADGKYVGGRVGNGPAHMTQNNGSLFYYDGFYTIGTSAADGSSVSYALYSANSNSLCPIAGAVDDGSFAVDSEAGVTVISVKGTNNSVYYYRLA